MAYTRYHILVFFTVIFAASQLGAKNDHGYRTGQQFLDSRKDFCRYIEKSLSEQRQQPQLDESVLSEDLPGQELSQKTFERIRSVQELLKPYLQRPVTLSSLPESWLHAITEKTLLLKYRRSQLKSQLSSLKKMTTLSSIDGSYDPDYQSHRADYQWPLQIKSLEDSLRKVEVQLMRLQSKTFTPVALFDLSLEMKTEEPPTPLGIRVVREKGWISDIISLYPAWYQSGQWTTASREPWLQVDAQFLPEDVRQTLYEQETPKLVSRYVASAEQFLPAENDMVTELTWLDSRSFIVQGNQHSNLLPTSRPLALTLPSDLSVMALFDLACLAEESFNPISL
ncbi:MAG: hypothetical protein AAF202_03520 [Pseudomonadota bacterium]